MMTFASAVTNCIGRLNCLNNNFNCTNNGMRRFTDSVRTGDILQKENAVKKIAS